tara:strand:- start:472 stop:633 length:162 start_codon:yes stop_codon:yes gene_type:complete
MSADLQMFSPGFVQDTTQFPAQRMSQGSELWPVWEITVTAKLFVCHMVAVEPM